MLLSPFTSPRRLAVLTILVFLAIVVLVRNSTYSEYLPSYDLPTFSNAEVPQDTTTGSSSFKEDAGKNGLWQEYKADDEKPQAVKAPVEEEYEEKPQAVKHTTIAAAAASHSPVAPPSESASTSPTASGSTTKITPLQHSSYSEIQAKIKDFIQWDRPNTPNHWPGFGDYVDQDYDPNRWEGLPM